MSDFESLDQSRETQSEMFSALDTLETIDDTGELTEEEGTKEGKKERWLWCKN